MIVGVRSALFQEDHMVRKVEMLAAKAGAVEGESAIEREGLKLAQDMPLKEQGIFTGATHWSPEHAQHYTSSPTHRRPLPHPGRTDTEPKPSVLAAAPRSRPSSSLRN